MAALTEKEKRELDATRRENGIKNMYYTRYFLIRYVVAFFFFINLYWILMFLWLPLVPFVCGNNRECIQGNKNLRLRRNFISK